ncbi:MAG: winged helix-turn-helix transcriptional regulator [Acidimicrobiales bacterium]
MTTSPSSALKLRVRLEYRLSECGRRYQDLDDALDGVSHKVLTDKLRRAKRDGLVARHLDPSRMETATLYELTELGRSLHEPSVSWNSGSAPSGRTSKPHADTGARAASSGESSSRVCPRRRYRWVPVGNPRLVEVPFCVM